MTREERETDSPGRSRTLDGEIHRWLSDLKCPSVGRREAMKWLAEQCLKSYRKEYGSLRFPLSMTRLARLRRITIIEDHDSRSSGDLIPRKNGFLVRLPPKAGKGKHSTARRYFSLAHEVGHSYFFDISNSPPSPMIPIQHLSAPQVERMCNMFAANLLLPEERLRPFSAILNSGTCALRNLEKAAQSFKVHPKTFAIRIKELELITHPTLFIVLAHEISPDEFEVDIITSPDSPVSLSFQGKGFPPYECEGYERREGHVQLMGKTRGGNEEWEFGEVPVIVFCEGRGKSFGIGLAHWE